MKKEEFQKYLIDNGFEEHIEFMKTIIKTFGKPKRYKFEHNGKVIWPPQQKEYTASYTEKREKGQSTTYSTRVTEK